jgi:hypothetical protein
VLRIECDVAGLCVISVAISGTVYMNRNYYNHKEYHAMSIDIISKAFNMQFHIRLFPLGTPNDISAVRQA